MEQGINRERAFLPDWSMVVGRGPRNMSWSSFAGLALPRLAALFARPEQAGGPA
jgi:hypothetical protein